MHIEYRVNERDYSSAVTLANKRRSNLSALEHFWPYLFAIVWISIGFLPGGGNVDTASSDDLYFELGAIPILMALLWGRRRQIQREYAKLSNLRLLHALDLDTNGLRLETSVGIKRTAWTVYTKFAENEDVFILYQEGNHDFFPIVKSFLTDSQNDELRSLLGAYLPAA